MAWGCWVAGARPSAKVLLVQAARLSFSIHKACCKSIEERCIEKVPVVVNRLAQHPLRFSAIAPCQASRGAVTIITATQLYICIHLASSTVH
ncbi:hypothetical protein BDW66DRAFT_140949 [Aspergillus desertorum]